MIGGFSQRGARRWLTNDENVIGNSIRYKYQ